MSFHLSGHTFRFRLQDDELSLVLPYNELTKSFHLNGRTINFCLISLLEKQIVHSS